VIGFLSDLPGNKIASNQFNDWKKNLKKEKIQVPIPGPNQKPLT